MQGWNDSSYIVTLGTIQPDDSGAMRNTTVLSIKLHSETQDSGRLGISGGGSPRHYRASKEKTLSITHHALLPPPSHRYLYIIHLIN